MKSWRYMKSVSNDRETVDEKMAGEMDIEPIPMPEEVNNWLSQLILLKEVPFAYLVVDERELPIESIRFFSIDPHWTQAMTDGAISIGAVTKLETLRAMRNMPRHYESAKVSVRLSRYENMHPNHRRQNGRMTTDPKTQFSGFVMRSTLVSNWKGIEVKGFTGETEQDILRMEALSDKVLICIFEGEIDAVKMYEPKEVLHFGTRSKDRKIDVRRIDAGHEGEPLYQAGTEEAVTIRVPAADNGRLKVNALRKALAEALGTAVDDFESPQVALEMLSVAGQCVFERGK